MKDRALFTQNTNLYERLGESGQLDERVRFVYDSPLAWRVTIELRADGTMPMRIANDGPLPEGPSFKRSGHVYEYETRDGDVHWLDANLP